MSTITTIAIIGAVETSLSFIARRIPQQYRVLLFDKDPVKLAELYDLLLINDPLANMEQMNCATNASWEADIVILSATCCSDDLIIQKIKQVSTGKIVIIINDEINASLSLNKNLSLQQLLKHVKLIQVSANINPAKTDIEKMVNLQGSDHAALETACYLFIAAGFTINYSSTPIL